MGDSSIVPSKCVRNLGGCLDKELSMVQHVRSIVKSVYYHIRHISKIRHYLDDNTFVKVIHATVTSRLDYHNGLTASLHDNHLRQLQIAQNNVVRLLNQD